MNGESEVRLTDLKTGALIKKKRLAQQDFGEGLVRTGDRLAPPEGSGFEVGWRGV